MTTRHYQAKDRLHAAWLTIRDTFRHPLSDSIVDLDLRRSHAAVREKITGKPKVIRQEEYDLSYAHVRHIELDNGFMNVFVRLVRPGPDMADKVHNTFDVDDCSVDTDKDGNIMGVTFTKFG